MKIRLLVLIVTCVLIAAYFLSCKARGYSLLVSNFPKNDIKIADREGVLLSEFPVKGRGYQTHVSLEEIPNSLRDMTLALEDKNFYIHGGVWLPSIVRAAVKNVLSLKFVEGGSTITQQLARMMLDFHAARKRGVIAKIDEALFAVYLELKYSKNWIFERYLNSVFLGNMAYGVESASVRYFSKHVSELSVSEQAMLASLMQAPSRLNPVKHGMQKALVLRMSKALSRIGERFAGNIALNPHVQRDEIAPHFVRAVMKKYEADTEPIIVTTLDAGIQNTVLAIVDKKLEEIAPENNQISAAVVVIDVKNGDCVAWVGSRNFWSPYGGNVDMALEPRHPGSALKPFTYFAAFQNGLIPSSLIEDEPHNYLTAEGVPYTPKNFDRRYHGIVSAREALANSFNVPAVAVLDMVGVPRFIELLKKFGIETINLPAEHYGLALTLGGGAVRLVDLTNAYAALARSGMYLPWRIIPGGPVDSVPVVGGRADEYSSLVTSILSDSYARRKSFGASSALQISNQEVAVKTGTSHSYRDKWTVGYSPYYAVGVWVGRADNGMLPGLTGVSAAAPIWHDVMEVLHKGLAPLDFLKPKGLEKIEDGKVLPAQTTASEARIVSPRPQDVFLIDPMYPLDQQKIPFEAKFSKTQNIEWFLDGRLINSGGRIFFKNINAGRHVAFAKIDGRETMKIPFIVKTHE